MKYAYPAIFSPEESGLISIAFPDVDGCYTGGKNVDDGIEMAEDALCLMLYTMEEQRMEIPPPTDISLVKCKKGEFVKLISCDTHYYQVYFDNKADKKTLTVPHWLNVLAQEKGANFSATLQKGLKEFCGINTD